MKYKRDFNTEYFKRLESFLFDPTSAYPMQIDIAKELHIKYGLPEIDILWIAMYIDSAHSLASKIEHEHYYSDAQELLRFERYHKSIKEVLFMGKNETLIQITNPHLIDKIYAVCIDHFSPKPLKDDKKKWKYSEIIKMIATEAYEELNKKYPPEEPDEQNTKALLIIGYIFVLYDIRVSRDEKARILTEKEYDPKYESYERYLGGRIKQYIERFRK